MIKPYFDILKIVPIRFGHQKVPWKGLPMQDSVSCDNNRTPVKFQRADIYFFVGEIQTFAAQISLQICGKRLFISQGINNSATTVRILLSESDLYYSKIIFKII